MSLTDFGAGCEYGDTPPPILSKQEYMARAREIAKEVNSDERYNTAYLVKLATESMDIFDLRNWPNGINRAEFDRLYDMDFEDSMLLFSGPGHFSYALRAAKKYFRADKELIWKAIETHRKEQLTRWASSWRRSIENAIKVMKGTNPADANYIDTWRGHGIDAWKELNRVLKELSLPSEPCPSDLTEPCYGDPLTWGE